MNEEIEQAARIYDTIVNYLITYSFQIVAAIFILIAGMYLARKVSDLVLSLLLKRNIDVTLSNFASGGLKVIIISFVVIIALGKLGISITPFVAAIGALSLGVGLALQGLLANYGAGVSIILTRPFVVGDTVKLLGVAGIVSEVKLAYTVLTNEDGVLITIPNKHIVGEIIHNSHEDTIIELSVGIARDSDPELAIEVLEKAFVGLAGESDKREPQIGIDKFGESSIVLGIRIWAKTEVYFQTKYQANKLIHQSLKDSGIEIPLPQSTVHLVKSNNFDN